MPYLTSRVPMPELNIEVFGLVKQGCHQIAEAGGSRWCAFHGASSHDLDWYDNPVIFDLFPDNSMGLNKYDSTPYEMFVFLGPLFSRCFYNM